jgi:D-inositol-3-phosphate glycosyltransferase
MSRRALAEATVIGCADAVLASCAVEAQQLRDLYGADPARTWIIPLGIDHAFFAPGNRTAARSAIGATSDGALCLFVGRIQPLKRVDLAVRALGELVRAGTDVSLIIVGGPSGHHGEATASALRDLVRELNLEHRVTFVPPKPHHLLSSYYRAADVVIVPSRSESFGLVALEAASCGAPVVASNVGGLSTLVVDRLSGVLIDEPDPSAYADAIRTILCDSALALRYSENAVAVASTYTWKKAATSFVEKYATVANTRLVGC